VGGDAGAFGPDFEGRKDLGVKKQDQSATGTGKRKRFYGEHFTFQQNSRPKSGHEPQEGGGPAEWPRGISKAHMKSETLPSEETMGGPRAHGHCAGKEKGRQKKKRGGGKTHRINNLLPRPQVLLR